MERPNASVSADDRDDFGFLFIARNIADNLWRRSATPALRIVRIDSWFGPRWHQFAGKLLGAVGVHGKRPLPVPPFNPNRVLSCWTFRAPGQEPAAEAPHPSSLDQQRIELPSRLQRHLSRRPGHLVQRQHARHRPRRDHGLRPRTTRHLRVVRRVAEKARHLAANPPPRNLPERAPRPRLASFSISGLNLSPAPKHLTPDEVEEREAAVSYWNSVTRLQRRFDRAALGRP